MKVSHQTSSSPFSPFLVIPYIVHNGQHPIRVSLSLKCSVCNDFSFAQVLRHRQWGKPTTQSPAHWKSKGKNRFQVTLWFAFDLAFNSPEILWNADKLLFFYELLKTKIHYRAFGLFLHGDQIAILCHASLFFLLTRQVFILRNFKKNQSFCTQGSKSPSSSRRRCDPDIDKSERPFGPSKEWERPTPSSSQPSQRRCVFLCVVSSFPVHPCSKIYICQHWVRERLPVGSRYLIYLFTSIHFDVLFLWGVQEPMRANFARIPLRSIVGTSRRHTRAVGRHHTLGLLFCIHGWIQRCARKKLDLFFCPFTKFDVTLFFDSTVARFPPKLPRNAGNCSSTLLINWSIAIIIKYIKNIFQLFIRRIYNHRFRRGASCNHRCKAGRGPSPRWLPRVQKIHPCPSIPHRRQYSTSNPRQCTISTGCGHFTPSSPPTVAAAVFFILFLPFFWITLSVLPPAILVPKIRVSPRSSRINPWACPSLHNDRHF